jgi:hypothetical protein
VSITYSPAYPLVGDTVALRMTRTIGGGAVEVERPEYRITATPPGSQLSKQDLLTLRANPTGTVLASTANTLRSFSTNLGEASNYWVDSTLTFTSGANAGRSVRIAAHVSSGGVVSVGDGLVAPPVAGDTFTLSGQQTERLSFKPDVRGEYTITGYVYREWAAAPEFDGDATGTTRRELVTSETVTVRVGVVADMPITLPGGFGITLRIKAHDAEVTAAELVNPLTRDDYLASQDSTVITKLAALAAVTTAGLCSDLPGKVATLRAEYGDHRILVAGSVHASTDSVNVYTPDRPYDQTNAVEALNRLRTILLGHLTGASAAGSRWHTEDDTKNVPIVGPATSLAQAYVLYADLAWRCYNRHRTQTAAPASHGAADNTNTLGSIDPLSDLFVAYLDFMADDSPTAPTGAEVGEVELLGTYGFSLVA